MAAVYQDNSAPKASSVEVDAPNLTDPQQGLPAISAPKGGGALRSIGDKVNVDLATGACSLSIPIALSPGRSNSAVDPALSLTYSSTAGNGPFGLGFSLSLPAITRKTDQGVPRYYDGEDSDIFVAAGSEDLTPRLRKDQNGTLITDSQGKFVIDEHDDETGQFRIRFYIPRVEGSFSRVERWTRKRDGDMFWRSISRNNITTLYGRDSNSRILDPSTGKSSYQNRTFSWLICEAWDSKGNAVVYDYKQEDSIQVDTRASNEQNRTAETRSANRYLKSIKYGNRTPNRDSAWLAYSPSKLLKNDWMFEVVLDYGDHQLENPTSSSNLAWPCRQDPYSTYRQGFEVRCYRLCRRILLFHHFPTELGDQDYLVTTYGFQYAENPSATYLDAVSISGHRKEGATHLVQSIPSLEFQYTPIPDGNLLSQLPVRELDLNSSENLPSLLGVDPYRWIDLEGSGLPGVLTEQSGAWYYKPNVSASNQLRVNDELVTLAKFESTRIVSSKPSVPLTSGAEFIDLQGDMLPDLVSTQNPLPGFFTNGKGLNWSSFQSFAEWPTIDLKDPNLRFIDLTGDGQADILITESHVFTWYASLGVDGFGSAEQVYQPWDEEKGPNLIFADLTESIYLADFSGDGLVDLVRIRHSEVCYWPNLGYGRFGAKVSMTNSPVFDTMDQFNVEHLRLSDLDGSGPTDIVYIGQKEVSIYYNNAGNSWSSGHTISAFPDVKALASFSVIDLLGNGTSCIVWSTIDEFRQCSLRYIDLMNGQKPHLLAGCRNNMGLETSIQYAPSTRFYLTDQRSGRDWITCLPFPVQCVISVTRYDHISLSRLSTRYAYHHGYYDGIEREFRGFAAVDSFDTEEYAETDLLENSATPWWEEQDKSRVRRTPTVHTKAWIDTGAFIDGNSINEQLAKEYFQESNSSTGGSVNHVTNNRLEDSVLAATSIGIQEEREARRALKGRVLRREVYAQDGSKLQHIPFSVAENNYTTVVIQPRNRGGSASFFAHSRETKTYYYERNTADPRIDHQMILEVDFYGNVLRSISFAYGRVSFPEDLPDDAKRIQEMNLISYTENNTTHPVDANHDFLAPMICETRSFEVAGVAPPQSKPHFQMSQFEKNKFRSLESLEEIGYQEVLTRNTPQKRLVEHKRILYRSEDLSALLPLRQIGKTSLPGQSYRLAMTSDMINTTFVRKLEDDSSQSVLPDATILLPGTGLGQGGYVDLDGNGSWWAPESRVYFHSQKSLAWNEELAEAQRSFYLPRRSEDIFGNILSIDYDEPNLLLPIKTEDSLSNQTLCLIDYRVLKPSTITDPNKNQVEFAFDTLGVMVGTAVKDKTSLANGDRLESFITNPTSAQVTAFINDPTSSEALKLLGNATSRDIYDIQRFQTSSGRMPTFLATISRQEHSNSSQTEASSKIEINFSHRNGSGQPTQVKQLTSPGRLENSEAMINPRWISNGWTVLNNKNQPVWKYEPFYTSTHEFESNNRVGVSTTLFYDPLGRLVSRLYPNHSWDKMVFDAWSKTIYDSNDTVELPGLAGDPRNDRDVGSYFKTLSTDRFIPTWYISRIELNANDLERQTAEDTLAHHNTPNVEYFDTLGRSVVIGENNGADGTYLTTKILDIEGHQIEMYDARQRLVLSSSYDIIGRCIYQASSDAGEQWMLADAMNMNIFTFNGRGFRFDTEFDGLRRPLKYYVHQQVDAPRILVGWNVYGEGISNAEVNNLRGRLYQSYDQAGKLTNASFDFKGNVIETERQHAKEYKRILNWSTEESLDDDLKFTSLMKHDAFSRPTSVNLPDGSLIRYIYSEAGILQKVHTAFPGDPTGSDIGGNDVVKSIEHNARGQRTSIEYGNQTKTSYTYDPMTFRCTDIKTERQTSILQNLHYIYDPVGNPVHIRDSTQQDIFFSGQRVEPSTAYTYDPLYRLIEASGREHLGQMTNATIPQPFDSFKSRVFSPSDGNAMGTYNERFKYDQVGNILEIKHGGSNATLPGWTKTYTYNPTNNRLIETTSGGTGASQNYSYDSCGNMVSVPHLSSMKWNFKNLLESTSKQDVNNGVPETTWYIYDGHGNRVRKVTERSNSEGDAGGTRQAERIYFDVFETYRKYKGDGNTKDLEKTTVHITDDKKRVLSFENRTIGSEGNSPSRRYRFQISNHNQSVVMELDGAGQILSYEEYYPFGDTSYQATDSQLETRKRYRFLGKERDEENALYYMGARYYAPWLGRWISCDPSGYVEGTDLYAYAQNNPIKLIDPGGMQSVSEEPLMSMMPEDMKSYEPPAPKPPEAPIMSEWPIMSGGEEAETGPLQSECPAVSKAAPEPVASEGPIMSTMPPDPPKILNRRGRELSPTGSDGNPIVGDNYLRRKDDPDFQDFEKAVGDLVDDPASDPSRAWHKSLDINTAEHNESTLKIINQALQAANKRYADPAFYGGGASKMDIYLEALHEYIVPLREKNMANSQNLQFRDADHFLTGVTQEWQRMLTFQQMEPKQKLEGASETVSFGYDLLKMVGIIGVRGKFSSLPPSPPGGREWAEWGRQIYAKDPDIQTPSAPPPPAPLIPTAVPF